MTSPYNSNPVQFNPVVYPQTQTSQARTNYSHSQNVYPQVYPQTQTSQARTNYSYNPGRPMTRATIEVTRTMILPPPPIHVITPPVTYSITVTPTFTLPSSVRVPHPQYPPPPIRRIYDHYQSPY